MPYKRMTYQHGAGRERLFHLRRDVFILPIQKTKYTCGPSALAAVLQLFGHCCDEMDLVPEIKAKPGQGTCHETLTAWCSETLPVTSAGSGTYQGGLGIANIINPFTGNGHYVVVLGKRGDHVRYFCPRIGEVVTTHTDAMTWYNSDRSLENWAISFEYPEDLFEKNFVAPARTILVLQ